MRAPTRISRAMSRGGASPPGPVASRRPTTLPSAASSGAATQLAGPSASSAAESRSSAAAEPPERTPRASGMTAPRGTPSPRASITRHLPSSQSIWPSTRLPPGAALSSRSNTDVAASAKLPKRRAARRERASRIGADMFPALDRPNRGPSRGPGAQTCLESSLDVRQGGASAEQPAVRPFGPVLDAENVPPTPAGADPQVRKHHLSDRPRGGRGVVRADEQDGHVASSQRVLHPRQPVVPVDQELLGVVRPPQRLAVQAERELPVVALRHHGRRDLRELVVELPLSLLRSQDQIGRGRLGSGEVELPDRRHDLDAALPHARVPAYLRSAGTRAWGSAARTGFTRSA